jgi:RNA polymerase primary sigma factor
MRRALANQSKIIRIPVQSASKISKIQAAKIILAEKFGRDPTDKEIAQEVNLTERTVNGLRQGKTSTVSIQAPFHPGEEGELKDILPDEKSLPPNDLLQDQETLLHMLSLTEKLEERERVILDLRFGLQGDPPKTLEQVSAAIGRTRERVRQIQNQALIKLRTMLESDGTITFVAANTPAEDILEDDEFFASE